MGLGSSIGVVLVELLFVVVTAVHIGWFPLQLLAVAPTLLLISTTFIAYKSPIWLLIMSRIKEVDVNNAVVLAVGAHHAALFPSSLRGRATAVFVTRFNVTMAYYFLTRSHILGGSSNLVLRVVYVAALVPIYVAMYVALNTMGHLQLMLVLFALLGWIFGTVRHRHVRRAGRVCVCTRHSGEVGG
ncbi:hypothetical protein MRX96_045089 [Rhipicephalus microplus]